MWSGKITIHNYQFLNDKISPISLNLMYMVYITVRSMIFSYIMPQMIPYLAFEFFYHSEISSSTCEHATYSIKAAQNKIKTFLKYLFFFINMPFLDLSFTISLPVTHTHTLTNKQTHKHKNKQTQKQTNTLTHKRTCTFFLN